MIIIKLWCKEYNKSYDLLYRHPVVADLLAYFLTDDVQDMSHNYITELEDNEYHMGAMNATQYSKDEEGNVIITPEWVIEEEVSIAKGNFFAIKACVLAQLLRQWAQVYAQRPRYIVITIEDDDTVHVVGTDAL